MSWMNGQCVGVCFSEIILALVRFFENLAPCHCSLFVSWSWDTKMCLTVG